jgi:CheY-like chemotaxis protein
MSELGRPRGDELVSLASHQLKTPLAVIAGHAELIIARAAQSEVRDEAAYIAEAAGQLGRALDGILALFALDTARILDAPQAISLTDLLDRAVAFSPGLRARHPRLPAGGLEQLVRGDPTRLAQALAALLSAGYAGVSEGTELTLDVEERRGLAMLSVGCEAGWPMGDSARLGLYVAARLVESDGASLFVREQGGAVSSVVMMLSTPGQTPATEQSRVLIVDDDDTMRRLLRATLPHAEGFEIIEASDGKQALELLEQNEPVHLVLLDWMMPGRSGADVLEQLRSRHPEVPVIVVTAELEPRQRELADSLGADIFLTKPFSPLQLLEHVERMLPRRLGDPAR